MTAVTPNEVDAHLRETDLCEGELPRGDNGQEKALNRSTHLTRALRDIGQRHKQPARGWPELAEAE